MTDYTVINPDRYAAGAALDNAILGDISKNELHNREEIALKKAEIEEGTPDSEPAYTQAHNKISAEQIVGTWFGQPLYEKSYEVTGATPGRSINVDVDLSCKNVVPRNDWCGTPARYPYFFKTIRFNYNFDTSRVTISYPGLEYSDNGPYGGAASFTVQYTKNSENP